MITNEILWIIFLVAELSITLLMYKLFGRTGLYAMIVGSTIIANIQVIKTVELFGLVATLGNIMYGSIFLCTDILSERHGKKEAKTGVWLGFCVLIITTITMQIALLFTPHKSDFVQPHLLEIFGFFPRVVAGSLIAYIISQNFDIFSFHKIKSKTNGRMLWLRNNISTMISQGIDSIIFCFIAFWGVFEISIFWNILLTTYIFKFIVAALDTPFLYLAAKIRPND